MVAVSHAGSDGAVVVESVRHLAEPDVTRSSLAEFDLAPGRHARASVAVIVVGRGGAAPDVEAMMSQFDTVVLSRDPRAAATALAALTPGTSMPKLPAGRPAARAAGPEPEPVEDGERIDLGDLRVDPGLHCATWKGRELPLTGQERVLLHCLLRTPRRVWTYQRLHEHVWGGAYLGDPAPVHSAVKRLRRKLTFSGVTQSVVTVRGVGFRLDEDPVASGVTDSDEARASAG